jgi:hypothetical protein
MAHHKISPHVPSTIDDAIRRDGTPRASLAARMTARIRAGHFDRLLAVGVPAATGSALAVHRARLTSTAERDAVARSLREVLREARAGGVRWSSRIPPHIPNVTAAEDLIDAITLRLHAPQSVSAIGMARLRQILGDGAGPLYHFGHGDLTGRLGAALAEL